MDSITVSDLRKYYGQVKAVDGLSFSVPQGEIFGMLGPNGAGKTTTVETIVGLIGRDGGDVAVMGIDPAQDPVGVKARIGVQLQTAAMFPRLAVREVIRLYASFYPKNVDDDEVIALVGLQEKANVQTRNLSGGQLQRLSVALAIVSDGDIIFLDEPTTGLDPQARRGIWDVINRMRGRGKTIFLTTHYMDEAEKLCDRVAVVDRGKIIALDSPQALINENFQEKAIEFNQPALTADRNLSGLPGVARVQVEDALIILYSSEVPKTIAALMEYSQKAGATVDDLTVRTATLEDVFLKLTGRRIRQ